MSSITNAEFPMDEQGRTYHVGAKLGQIASRIITVGDHHRAKRIAQRLDLQTTVHESKRGFLTITGEYKGVAVSIIAIGMGAPMADMFMREVRATVAGPILLIRFGSCGGVGEKAAIGCVSVAKQGAVMVSRAYDYFQYTYGKDEARHSHTNSATGSDMDVTVDQSTTIPITEPLRPYNVSKVCPADEQLSDALIHNLSRLLGVEKVITGVNVTADSFYSSQGRMDIAFEDTNADLIQNVRKTVPNCETFEMETFILLHLAKCATYRALQNTQNMGPPLGTVRAAACAMVFANRKHEGGFIDQETINLLEDKGGLAVLDSITSCSL